jgi:hypothetical protein
MSSTVPFERLLAALPWLCRPRATFFLYVAIALAASVTTLLRSKLTDFDIFRQSFMHLWNGSPLYIPYPSEQPQLFKYSPLFAVLMAPFWALPKWAGLPLWNILNALTPLLAVNRLHVSSKAKAFILLFSVFELTGSIQVAESNGIVAGLMIGTFAALEDDRPLLAALLACLGLYLKVFGITAAAFAIFYKSRWRFTLALLLFIVVLGLLPVMATGSLDGLSHAYKDWFDLLRQDQTPNNLSLMGFAQQWFHLDLSNLWFQIPASLLFVALLARRSAWKDFHWRLRFLSFALMFVIVFNHRTETSTLVIEVFGFAIWGIVESPSWLRSFVLALAWATVSLSSNSVFSVLVQRGDFDRLGVKALPGFLLWAHNAARLAFSKASAGSAPREGPPPGG